jgi:hypothetical protein
VPDPLQDRGEIEAALDLAADAARAWLHVDGAFGLFARLVPELVDAGVRRN